MLRILFLFVLALAGLLPTVWVPKEDGGKRRLTAIELKEKGLLPRRRARRSQHLPCGDASIRAQPPESEVACTLGTN